MQPAASVNPVLLAEDLLLLLTNDESGKLVVSGSEADVALAGALLMELTLGERIELAGESGEAKKGTVVVRDGSPTGDALLDEALATLGHSRPKKPQDLLGKLGKDIRPRLYERLATAGVVRAEQGKVLGIFPTSRWPERDATHERELRDRLSGILVQGDEPDPRTASVVAVLHALRTLPKVIDAKAHGIPKRDLNSRATAISEGNWGSQAVRRAIDDMTAAIVAATAAVVVSTSASGD